MTRHLSSPISRPGTPRWEWQQSHFLFPSSKPFVISYQLNQSNLLVLDWLGSHQTECAKTNWDFVSTGAQPHSPEVMTPKTLKTNWDFVSTGARPHSPRSYDTQNPKNKFTQFNKNNSTQTSFCALPAFWVIITVRWSRNWSGLR